MQLCHSFQQYHKRKKNWNKNTVCPYFGQWRGRDEKKLKFLNKFFYLNIQKLGFSLFSQEFHLKTSERAMQHAYASSSSSCNDSDKVGLDHKLLSSPISYLVTTSYGHLIALQLVRRTKGLWTCISWMFDDWLAFMKFLIPYRYDYSWRN